MWWKSRECSLNGTGKESKILNFYLIKHCNCIWVWFKLWLYLVASLISCRLLLIHIVFNFIYFILNFHPDHTINYVHVRKKIEQELKKKKKNCGFETQIRFNCMVTFFTLSKAFSSWPFLALLKYAAQLTSTNFNQPTKIKYLNL